MEEISRDILLSVKRGDTEAFRVVVRHYRKFVFSVIYRFLAGRHPKEVEKMTRDIFVKIYSFSKSYDPDKEVKYSACVYTIVKNYCFNELRIKRLEVEPPEEYGGFEHEGDIEDGVLGGELKKRFEKCIETLPDDQRIILILRAYEGFAYEETGMLLSLEQSEVKAKFNKAKAKLKDLLWPYLKEDHGKTL